jgi:predicted membrane-bound mannosyltransferase
VATFARYSDRAGGEGHEKPWYYFIGLLVWTRREGVVWTEMMVLALAAAGLVAMLLRTREPRPALPVFLAVYTLAQIAIYAVIPYKTPWLALGFIHGLVLLAGFGAQECWRLAGNPVAKLLIGATLTAGVAQLAAQSCRANFRYAADERNPWVYSHTSTDAPRLVRNIRDAAALDPQGKAIVIKIITPEYWPLPWYLRDFQRVGYWNDVPDDPQAPIVITTAELANKVVAKLKGDYARDFAGLRPGFVLEVFVRRDLWEGMIAARSRPARP